MIQRSVCFRHRLARPVRMALPCCFIAVMASGLTASAVAQHATTRPATSASDLIALSREVEKEVEELRGWKFKRPVKTDVRTEEQLRAFIEKKVFEEEYGPDGLRTTEAFLRMIGLIPANCDLRQTIVDVLLNQVGGFYDPGTDAFYMMQRGGVDYGPLVNRIMIAHELTHALDDQYFELNKLIRSRPRTEDWSLAIGSVLEGSATALMTRYTMKAQLTGKYDLNDLQQVMRQEMERSRKFIEAPPYFTTLMATYMAGMNFVARGDLAAFSSVEQRDSVADNVKAAASDPPQSTEQILHPEKYWDRSQRDNPVVVDDDRMTHLLETHGLRVMHKDTVGELLCGVLTAPADRQLDMMLAASPSYWTTEAATGWGGDRFYLVVDKKVTGAKGELGAARGVWVTAWDTPSDADEFVEDYKSERELAGRRDARLSERVAVFLFGFSDEAAQPVIAALRDQPLLLSKDGKPWSSKP